MRIAFFLLPYNHPSGRAELSTAHQYARSRLIAQFGGYTASEVTGAWKDATGAVIRDTSIKYDVAHDWQGNDVKEFILIAREAGALQPKTQDDPNRPRHSGQGCVLVSDPWGEITLPDCKVTPKDGYSHTRI